MHAGFLSLDLKKIYIFLTRDSSNFYVKATAREKVGIWHHVRYLFALSSYDIVPSFTNPEIMTAAGHLDKLAPAYI